MKDSVVFQKIKDLDAPVFIWGNGEIGGVSRQKLEKNGIAVDGFVVNDKSGLSGTGTFDVDYLNKNYNRYIIIKGFLNALTMQEAEVKEIFPRCVGIFSVSEIYTNVEKLSIDFFEANKSSFEAVAKLLQDDFSKQSLNAYFKAKTEEDAEFLHPFIVTPQYFFNNPPWKLYDNEVLADCGAYVGDSIADFIDISHGNYEKIYAFEPDPENMRLLKKYCAAKGLSKVDFIEKGLSDEEHALKFDMRNDMLSAFSENGDAAIEVTSIDRVLFGKRVSIIKMDIEGFEMAALRGAENTIVNHRPMLYISAYHKARDIFEIVNYVENLKLDYRWFFRLHKPLAIDAVLYGIPKERTK